MNCDFFEKYETGQIEEAKFQEHLKECSICQQKISEDEKLMTASRALRQPVESPGLWEKIEKSLIEEESKKNKTFHKYFPIFRIAAVLVLIFGLTLIFITRNKNQDSKLLVSSVLKQVEQKEKDLEETISELEKIALPKLSNMNLELMFLYRDRLETIEAQIVQCKDMLNENPANAHLRRYLLAAYKDKKETLSELLNNYQL